MKSYFCRHLLRHRCYCSHEGVLGVDLIGVVTTAGSGSGKVQNAINAAYLLLHSFWDKNIEEETILTGEIRMGGELYAFQSIFLSRAYTLPGLRWAGLSEAEGSNWWLSKRYAPEYIKSKS